MDSNCEEMLQIVDARGRFLRAASRAECHEDRALIHRSVCILLFNAAGELYIQRRAMAKDTYPGQRDLSATGHVRAGEAEDEAATRELAEELSVWVEIEHVDTMLLRLPAETELATIYRCSYEGTITTDPTELAGGAFHQPAEAIQLPDLTPYAGQILARLGYG